MRYFILLFLFLFSVNSYSTGVEGVDWIVPTSELVQIWSMVSDGIEHRGASPQELCPLAQVPDWFSYETSRSVISLDNLTWNCKILGEVIPPPDATDPTPVPVFQDYPIHYVSQSIVSQCKEAPFINSEDNDGDGVTDHCHTGASQVCDDFSLSQSSSTSESICQLNEFGAICLYTQTNAPGIYQSCADCFCDCPNGQCDTAQPPQDPNPEQTPPIDSTCTQYGSELWCEATPDDCQESVGPSGGVQTCANCGQVNDKFLCINPDAPHAETCTVDDTRLECSGLVEGSCPIGFVCDFDVTPQPQPCTETDTRPECVGVPVGEVPPTPGIDSGGVDNSGQLQEIIDGDKQRNSLLDKILAELKGDPAAAEKAVKDEEEKQKKDLDDQISDTTSEQGLIDKEGGFLSSLSSKLLPSLVPPSSCKPIDLLLPRGGHFIIDVCFIASFIRPILSWIFMIASLLYIRESFVDALS